MKDKEPKTHCQRCHALLITDGDAEGFRPIISTEGIEGCTHCMRLIVMPKPLPVQ